MEPQIISPTPAHEPKQTVYHADFINTGRYVRGWSAPPSAPTRRDLRRSVIRRSRSPDLPRGSSRSVTVA